MTVEDKDMRITNIRKNVIGAALFCIIAVSVLHAQKDAEKKHEWPFAGGNHGLTGVSPDTSVKPPFKRKWAYLTPSGRITAVPCAAAGRIYISMTEGGILALDAETGILCWKRLDLNTGFNWPGSSCDGKRVYHRQKNILRALDAETGKTLWTYTACKDHRKRCFTGKSTPMFAEGIVFFGRFDDTGAYAVGLNADTGKKVWSTLIGKPDWSISMPSYANGMFYVRSAHWQRTNNTGCIVAIKASDGKIVWKRDDIPVSTEGSACSTDGRIVCVVGGAEATAKGGEPLVLDAKTGKTLWSAWENGQSRGRSWHWSPVLYGNYILAGVEGIGSTFDIYDRNTGGKVGRAGLPSGASNCSVPAVSGRYAYMGGGLAGAGWRFGKGQRYAASSLGAIDMKARKPVWIYRLHTNTCSSPIIAYGKLYMCGAPGWVWCFEPVDKAPPPYPKPDLPQIKKWRSKDLKFSTCSGSSTKPAGGRSWPMYGGCPARCGLDLSIKTPIMPAWKFDTGGEVYSSAAIDRGTAYVGSDSGKLFALDLASGRKKWEFQADGPVHCSPAVGNGIVAVGADDGNMYGIDANTGKEKWSFQTLDWVRASPAIVDNTVVFGSWDRCVYALDLATGKKHWRYATHHKITAPPAVHNGRVFAGSGDWAIYGLDLASGRLLWHLLWGPATGTAVYKDMLVTLTMSGSVVCLCPENGHMATKKMGGNKGGGFGAPAFSKDMMYTARCGSSRDGLGMYNLKEGKKSRSWYQSKGSGCMETALVSRDLMIIATIQGTVEAHTLSDGTTRSTKLWEWKTPSGKMFHTAPAAASGYIVAGNDDGYVYGFRYRGK